MSIKIDENIEIGNTGISLKELTEKNIITAFSSTNQSVSNHTKINLASSVGVGTKLSLSNGQIVIGTDVAKVKISGNIFYQDFPLNSGQYMWGQIKRNQTVVASTIVDTADVGFRSCSIPTKIIEVSTGDVIELSSGDVCGNSMTVRGNTSGHETYLTVEVVS